MKIIKSLKLSERSIKIFSTISLKYLKKLIPRSIRQSLSFKQVSPWTFKVPISSWLIILFVSQPWMPKTQMKRSSSRQSETEICLSSLVFFPTWIYVSSIWLLSFRLQSCILLITIKSFARFGNLLMRMQH